MVAKRELEVVHWNPRFLHLRGHHPSTPPPASDCAFRRAHDRAAASAQPLPPARFDYAYARKSRMPPDGYLRHWGSFEAASACDDRGRRPPPRITTSGATPAISPGCWDATARRLQDVKPALRRGSRRDCRLCFLEWPR